MSARTVSRRWRVVASGEANYPVPGKRGLYQEQCMEARAETATTADYVGSLGNYGHVIGTSSTLNPEVKVNSRPVTWLRVRGFHSRLAETIRHADV